VAYSWEATQGILLSEAGQRKAKSKWDQTLKKISEKVVHTINPSYN
jgi:hypothetical protein